MDFGELKNDTDFIEKIRNFDGCLDDIEQNIEKIQNFKGYDDLAIEDKVKYDIFLTYTVNSLYFFYMKLQGNQKNEDIKHELGRIKTAMKRNSDIHDSRTKRPRLDQGAAKRFVKSGLWDKDDLKRPANKHKRFE